MSLDNASYGPVTLRVVEGGLANDAEVKEAEARIRDRIVGQEAETEAAFLDLLRHYQAEWFKQLGRVKEYTSARIERGEDVPAGEILPDHMGFWAQRIEESIRSGKAAEAASYAYLLGQADEQLRMLPRARDARTGRRRRQGTSEKYGLDYGALCNEVEGELAKDPKRRVRQAVDAVAKRHELSRDNLNRAFYRRKD